MSDWRDDLLAHIRSLILEADPHVVEEAKWVKPSNPAGVATWSHDGIICTGERYRDKVKLTFASGASLPDPSRLFNASLDAGTRRAIDLVEGAELDPEPFQQLVREAVELNVARAAAKRRR
ncbi:MAG: DUF1801 domain-containing protein [Ilumatobacteraceae bacterium]|nr:DUF1801 domain-containing protein [Acidimicrobiaceae bacterium]